MLNLLGSLIQTWYTTLGYGGIVLAMALESCLIPLPSEVVMPLAGAYTLAAFGARFSLPGVALAGAVGCLIGSLAAYALGAAGGRPFILRYGPYLLISHRDFERADRAFTRFGAPITLVSRLLPIVRTYISLPAGITRMRLLPFMLYTFLGSLIWCLALGWVGQQLGTRYDQLASVFHGADVLIVVVLALLVLWYVRRHLHELRELRKAREVWRERTVPLSRLPVPPRPSMSATPARPPLPEAPTLRLPRMSRQPQPGRPRPEVHQPQGRRTDDPSRRAGY